MHKRLVVTLAILALTVSALTGCKKEEQAAAPETTAPATTTAPTETAPATTAVADSGLTGEQLYKQHCAVCHPEGGNTINPSKPVGKESMASRNITTHEHIVNAMRNPGPGMNKFDESVISDEDARKVAEYMLSTFK